MFENIGGKIKTLAKVLMWIGIIGFVIYGIVMISEEQVLLGFLIIAIGGLSSWVSSFVLYGFGQLVENSDKLVCNNGYSVKNATNKNLDTLEKWRKEGLITEEEYQQKRANM